MGEKTITNFAISCYPDAIACTANVSCKSWNDGHLPSVSGYFVDIMLCIRAIDRIDCGEVHSFRMRLICSALINFPVFQICRASNGISSMSSTLVRAAQVALILKLFSDIALAMAKTSALALEPAPGKPISAQEIPSCSISSSSSNFLSTSGSVTEGDCNPSRSVSS